MDEIPSLARFVITEGVHELRTRKNLKGPFKTWSNKSGIIRALLFSLPDERNQFILIGRGTDLYKGLVSCQEEEFAFANNQNIPLVTALKVSESQINFYVFLPAWIKEGNLERNKKFKTVVSFSFSLGEYWDLVESLRGILSRLNTRWEKAEKEKADFAKFKKDAETISFYMNKKEKIHDLSKM